MKIYVSPSQLATFKECRRKWAYRYIDGIKAPPKKEQEFGLEGHKRNEGWLRNAKHVGDDDVGLVCQQGIKPGYMPTPASDLLIEAKLEIPILDGKAKMIGYVDCVLPPRQVGEAKIWTMPVCHDWKFTKDLRWAMTPSELFEDSQAAVYTYWLQRKYDAAKVVARWVYFCGRLNSKSQDGRPRTPRGVKKVELAFTKSEVEANWQREMEIARQLVETKIKYKKADDVPPNELHCDAYGGCDHRERCPLGDEFGLGAMIEQWDRTHQTPDQKVEKMSAEEVLAKVRAHKAALLAQQTQAPAAGAPPAAPATATPAAATSPEAGAPPVASGEEGLQATMANTQPPAEPQKDTTAPTGIELVAELQRQSGTVDEHTHPIPTQTPDLLATLQAQSGATTINPPEAAAAAEAPKVVVPKAEPNPEVTAAELEKLVDGSHADGLATHEGIPPPPPGGAVAVVGQVIETHTGEPPPPAEPAGAVAVGLPPDATVAEVPPAKPTKSKKSNTTKATKPPFVLAIDAVASKLQNGALGQVVHLSEFVEPFTKAIAKGYRSDEHPQGVDHWGLLDFGKGASLLAHHVACHLDNKGFSGVLVVDSYTAEARALTNILIRRADVVFRGVR